MRQNLAIAKYLIQGARKINLVRRLQPDLAATREPLTSLGKKWPIDASDIFRGIIWQPTEFTGALRWCHV